MSNVSTNSEEYHTCHICGQANPLSDFESTNKYTLFAKCSKCGHALGGVGDPILECEDGGNLELIMTLEESGPNLTKVASIICSATDLTVPESLKVARKTNTKILQEDHHRFLYLQDLQQALHSAGARVTITTQKINSANKSQ